MISSATGKNDNTYTTTYEYDGDGNVISKKGSNINIDKEGLYKNGYDYMGNVTSYTDPEGNVTEYTYNDDGRAISRTSPSGAVEYGYDGNSNLLTVTDKNGTITRTYDKLNRVEKYIDVNGNTTEYGYDEAGNLTALKYPDGKTVSYLYYENGKLESVTDWEGRKTIYTYKENGRLDSITRPDGSKEVYNYDDNGQVLTVTNSYANGNTINQYYLEYDEDGNIIKETSLNEPEKISIPSAEMNYETANRLNEFNGIGISYDADGNALNTPLNDSSASLSYDEFSNLTSVGDTTTYTYDAEGYRIAKTEKGVTTDYVVNTNSGLSQVLMATTGNETTYYIYGIGLIGQESSDGYKAYHFDSRGSTVALTDMNGNVTDTMFYDPYGNIVSRTGTTDTPYLYVGEYGVETDDCGLCYMRARYYNPVIKRFVNADPIRSGYNWYGYTSGNPISYIDPTGYLNYRTQLDDFARGIWGKMCDFSDYVDSGNKEFWSKPSEYMSQFWGYAWPEIKEYAGNLKNIDGKQVKSALGSVVVGIFETMDSVDDRLFKLSPLREISDEEAYRLGYDVEGAALGASETALKAYVVGKGVQVVKSGLGSAKGILSDNTGGVNLQTPNQKALLDIARESEKLAKRGYPISEAEARILDEWAVEYNVPQHHQAYSGSGQHFKGGNYSDHTHIYGRHVPYQSGGK